MLPMIVLRYIAPVVAFVGVTYWIVTRFTEKDWSESRPHWFYDTNRHSRAFDQHSEFKDKFVKRMMLRMCWLWVLICAPLLAYTPPTTFSWKAYLAGLLFCVTLGSLVALGAFKSRYDQLVDAQKLHKLNEQTRAMRELAAKRDIELPADTFGYFQPDDPTASWRKDQLKRISIIGALLVPVGLLATWVGEWKIVLYVIALVVWLIIHIFATSLARISIPRLTN